MHTGLFAILAALTSGEWWKTKAQSTQRKRYRFAQSHDGVTAFSDHPLQCQKRLCAHWTCHRVYDRQQVLDGICTIKSEAGTLVSLYVSYLSVKFVNCFIINDIKFLTRQSFGH